MKHIKLSKFWDGLRSSYWFLPTLMAAGAIVLAFTLLALDRSNSIDISNMSAFSWIFEGGAEGARAVLSVISGSMVTVAVQQP